MDTSLLRVEPNAPEPIYRQIIAQVRRLIASGQLAAGASLPSVRDIAAAHAINPMTVSKAYSLLEAEGLLERQRGKGMVVSAQARRPKPVSERMALIEPGLTALARQAQELELPAERVLRRLEALLNKENA